ncbi:MAG TPA: hypothetical protein VHW45_11130 [Candidatus Sulfotelmatobacter sp.]|nr:hypothetical protein [Candidatus Sulfotelmatobacter sp.]
MSSGLYWIAGSWPGRLAVAARPRGGDWLPAEIAYWKQSGVKAVLSLLTGEEERDLDLRDEAKDVRSLGLEFFSLAVPDRQVPPSETQMARTLDKLTPLLSSGKNVLVHCHQGGGSQRAGRGLAYL